MPLASATDPALLTARNACSPSDLRLLAASGEPGQTVYPVVYQLHDAYGVCMGYPARYPGTCPDCGTPREVSGTYEAVLCRLCDEWQSALCGRCQFCRDRPARPSQAAQLDLAPHERHANYNLDMEDADEVLRRVVTPVLAGTLPAGVVAAVEIIRKPGWPVEHWPTEVPVPESIYCRVTFTSGEQDMIYLEADGQVDPEALADSFASQVEDGWSESSTGWGQEVQAVYEVLPSRSD